MSTRDRQDTEAVRAFLEATSTLCETFFVNGKYIEEEPPPMSLKIDIEVGSASRNSRIDSSLNPALVRSVIKFGGYCARMQALMQLSDRASVDYRDDAMNRLTDLELSARKFLSHSDIETVAIGHQTAIKASGDDFIERMKRIRDISMMLVNEAAAFEKDRPRLPSGGINHLRKAYVANVVNFWRKQIGETPGSDKGWFRDILTAGWLDLGFPTAGVGDLHEAIGAAIKADFRTRQGTE